MCLLYRVCTFVFCDDQTVGFVLGGRVCVSFGFKVRFLPLQGDNSDIHTYFAGFCSVLDKITGH